MTKKLRAALPLLLCAAMVFAAPRAAGAATAELYISPIAPPGFPASQQLTLTLTPGAGEGAVTIISSMLHYSVEGTPDWQTAVGITPFLQDDEIHFTIDNLRMNQSYQAYATVTYTAGAGIVPYGAEAGAAPSVGSVPITLTTNTVRFATGVPADPPGTPVLDWYDGGDPVFSSSVPPALSRNACGFVLTDTSYRPSGAPYFQGMDFQSYSVYNGRMEVTAYGLNPGRTYYVWAYVQSGGGDWIYSNSSLLYRSGTISVTTDRAAENNDGSIRAEGSFRPGGGGGVTEYGFVYSGSSRTPTVTDAEKMVVMSGTYIYDWTDFRADIHLPAYPSNQTVYVRAYAVMDGSVNYGDVLRVSVTGYGNVPGISSLTARGLGFTADIRLQDYSNAHNITEWGVVYSASQASPALGAPHTMSRYGTGAISQSNRTVEVAGLTANTRFYVRAYVRIGGNVVYSDTEQVRTGAGINVSIVSITNANHYSATLNGSLSRSAAGLVTEKGFVYSSTDQMPTISNNSIKHSSTAAGDFSVVINNLAPETTYFIRAYARTTGGEYVYSGDARQFTTASGDTTVTVAYIDHDGRLVGTQTLHQIIGYAMTAKSLTPPEGYRLADQNWSHVAAANEGITVPVESTAKPEAAYIQGLDNYRFGPDLPVTHMEAASMIYALFADESQTYYHYPPFNDAAQIPSDAHSQNIVNFVASKDYMSGDEMGNFNPRANITRAELSSAVTKIAGYFNGYEGIYPIPSLFNDTARHWGREYITLAQLNGVFEGIDLRDNNFRPDQPVTRAELAVIFMNAFERSGAPLGSRNFTDVPPAHWAYRAIMNASEPRQ